MSENITFEHENILLKLVNQLITEKHYDGIEILMQDNRNIKNLKNNTTDFIELCKNHMTDENFHKNSNLYFACENLLKTVAEFSSITDVLFELLEIMDSVKSDNVFTSALKALQVCLLRKECDRKTLEWGLTQVISYLLELDCPDFLTTGYDEKQRVLLEQNDQVHKILLNYITVRLFYEPILEIEMKKYTSTKYKLFKSTEWDKMNVLASFLLRLLGRPLALLDLSNKEKLKTNTHSLQCAQQITGNICLIFKDPYYLLSFVESRCRWKKKNSKYKIDEPRPKVIYMDSEKFPLLTFAIFYYMLIAEDLMPTNAPLIYSPVYIFESNLYLVEHLLREDEPVLHYKAIILCEQILNNLVDFKISSSSLDLKINSDFCRQLTKIVVYSEHEEIRKQGINLFKKFIHQFDSEGQFIILKNLMETTKHNGLLGYFITTFKNLVSSQLDHNNELKSFCTGGEFKYILKLCCKLENGAETDLIQNSDQIISALNILRYFAQRDSENSTGFWNFINEIVKEFLNPLRDGLNISRAHYIAEEHRVQNDIEIKGEIELFEKFMINNETLPNFDKKQKLNILSSAIVTFDLIESINRNLYSLTPSALFVSQLHWNTNFYYSIRRNRDKTFIIQIPTCKDLSFYIKRRNNFSTTLNNPTIDDFRAREKAKEKAYKQQETDKEKLAVDEKVNKVKGEKLAAVRLKILEASLPFVEQYGWTIDALTSGAEKAGFPGIAHGLLPNGSIELILYFYGSCNSKLVKYLKEQTKNGENLPKESAEFLAKAAKYRLEMLIPYKKHWPQALAKMALPQNVPKSLAQILTMIDDICYFAGDRSVDFGWYTRRVGMSTIYKLTELYMLQDKSENHKATWEFLKNRMAEAQIVELVFGQTGEPNQRTKNRLNATFETARNILGLNYDRRI